MKYRIKWDPDAFRKLVRLYTAASEPDAAVRAFDEIERTLSTDADRQGESRYKGRRILIVPPLGVVFRAKPEIGEVLILDAWLIRDRKDRQ